MCPAPDPTGGRRPILGPFPPLALSTVVEEVLARAATFRIGPDRLPVAAFNDADPAVAWAAYWYRDHARCAPLACECSNSGGQPRYPRTFGGEGVALVVYADGYVGVYSLDHGRGEVALDWGRLATAHAAGAPRLTPADVEELRAYLGGAAPRFPFLDGSGERIPAPGADTVWAAWDVGVARFGVPAMWRAIARVEASPT